MANLNMPANELGNLFNKIPIPIYILEENFSISIQNEAARTLTHKVEGESRGKQMGDVLRCINAVNDSGGCGTTENCHSCPIRETIKKTARTKQDIKGVETTLESIQGEQRNVIWIRLSTGFQKTNDKKKSLSP